MYKGNDYIYDAAQTLEQLTGLAVSIEGKEDEHNAIIRINGKSFYVEAKNEIRKENEGLLIDLLTQPNEASNMIIAKYIAIDTAEKLKAKQINYLDVSGNCYIKVNDSVIYISGQKTQRKQKTNQAKAFQETGIKLLFHLLSEPDNLQLPYRELAELADISIGSVSNIITELESLHFILKAQKKRVLKNKPELLERWVVAYHDVLRPRLLKRQMGFVKSNDWKTVELGDEAYWGGESGAAILTNQIIPEKFPIYTNSNWQNIGRKLRLVPDDNGHVDVLQQFWKDKDNKYKEKQIVPPLLIYADLMGSGYGRNIETAKTILENELPHIK